MNFNKFLIDTGLNSLNLNFNADMFELALMHSSYSKDNNLGKLENNERLEFYGDSVLKLACSKYLYETFPEEREGKLSSYRSVLVSDAFLAKYSEDINLREHLIFSDRADLKTKKAMDTMAACAFEAILGVIFIQSDFDTAYKFLVKFFDKNISYVESNLLKINAKATLQEYTQGQNKTLPTYFLVEEIGRDHEKKFIVGVKFNEQLISIGEGFSKKEAEQEAAYKACLKLGVINE